MLFFLSTHAASCSQVWSDFSVWSSCPSCVGLQLRCHQHWRNTLVSRVFKSKRPPHCRPPSALNSPQIPSLGSQTSHVYDQSCFSCCCFVASAPVFFLSLCVWVCIPAFVQLYQSACVSVTICMFDWTGKVCCLGFFLKSKSFWFSTKEYMLCMDTVNISPGARNSSFSTEDMQMHKKLCLWLFCQICALGPLFVNVSQWKTSCVCVQQLSLDKNQCRHSL